MKQVVAVIYMLIVNLASFDVFGYDPMAPPGYSKGTIDNAMQGVAKKETVTTKPAETGFILRQVVISPSGKSAVINGYIVNEGSYLKNAYVKSIEANSVTLLVKGKTRQLTLEESVPRIRR